MALGDTYSNNTADEPRKPEIYSAYSMSNKDGLVDPSMLSIRFWNGMMKLSIFPKLPNPTTEHVWNKDDGMTLYLNHTKARELAIGIDMVMDTKNAKKPIHSYGVITGKDGLVCFSDGKEIGIDSPCLIFRKIDQENGNVISSYIYEFRVDYHYAVINFNPKDASYDRITLDSIEVEQFKDILKSYYNAMTSAIAYSVVNTSQFRYLTDKVDKIGESVGISSDKPNYAKKGGTSYFNKSDGSGFKQSSVGLRSATIDEIENALSASES